MRREDILPSVLKVFWFCFSLMLQIGRFFPLSTLGIFPVLWTCFCDVSCVVEYNSQLCCCVGMFSSLCPYFCQDFPPSIWPFKSENTVVIFVRRVTGVCCSFGDCFPSFLFSGLFGSLVWYLTLIWEIFLFFHFVIMISKIPPISLFPTLLDLSRY